MSWGSTPVSLTAQHNERSVAYVSIVSSQSEAAAAATLPAALERLPRTDRRWVLAVSGGRDSMVLLHAMSALRRDDIAAVATFDHGTGPAAREACALVVREAAVRGVPAVRGVMPRALGSGEERWRAARWRFLAQCATKLDAAVMTAHTRDDQVETIVMRLLRDAGPRGLAGMYASTPVAWGLDGDAPPGAFAVVRPLLDVGRGAVAAYARAFDVPFVEDPSNASMAFQRNRVRRHLLPALERASPGFSLWCLDLAGRASAWRRRMDELAVMLTAPDLGPAGGAVVIPAAPLASLREAEWQVLWPALAARAGIAMDRRGLVRASTWAPRATGGSRIPLSGDARIERTASTFVIRAGERRMTVPAIY